MPGKSANRLDDLFVHNARALMTLQESLSGIVGLETKLDVRSGPFRDAPPAPLGPFLSIGCTAPGSEPLSNMLNVWISGRNDFVIKGLMELLEEEEFKGMDVRISKQPSWYLRGRGGMDIEEGVHFVDKEQVVKYLTANIGMLAERYAAKRALAEEEHKRFVDGLNVSRVD